ncbi:MAG: hypothetical protein ACI9G1_002577 [Pirellulaceae bacterium]|jgi:hypothetical protein
MLMRRIHFLVFLSLGPSGCAVRSSTTTAVARRTMITIGSKIAKGRINAFVYLLKKRVQCSYKRDSARLTTVDDDKLPILEKTEYENRKSCRYAERRDHLRPGDWPRNEFTSRSGQLRGLCPTAQNRSQYFMSRANASALAVRSPATLLAVVGFN